MAIIKPWRNGALATFLLLAFYFIILTLVSGFAFALEQFKDNWYFIVALTLGFGIQVGLFTHARALTHAVPKTVVAASGTTSATAMIACCAHYVVTLVPILGVTGLVSFVAQYQPWLFGVGLLSNVLGIAYMLRVLKHIKMKNNLVPL